jgi:hypothetical protein
MEQDALRQDIARLIEQSILACEQSESVRGLVNEALEQASRHRQHFERESREPPGSGAEVV